MQEYELLKNFYETEGPEELRLQEDSVQYLEFLTAAKYLDHHLPARAKVLDNCAGSSVYSFYLAKKGHCVTAGDLLPCNVDIIHEKQQTSPFLHDIYLGDALNLSRFEPGSFQAVLCMGALYHLHEAEDRKKAVEESLRVLADGGIFACTYMNRYSVILSNSQGALENIDEILRFAALGREGIFYASTPEEIEDMMHSCGVKKLAHVALDGMSNFMHLNAKLLDDEGLLRWREYHFATCEVPSLLGASYHNMFIGTIRA